MESFNPIHEIVNLENIHLHVNLNVGFLSPKWAITHPIINSESVTFLTLLIGLRILNTCFDPKQEMVTKN